MCCEWVRSDFWRFLDWVDFIFRDYFFFDYMLLVIVGCVVLLCGCCVKGVLSNVSNICFVRVGKWDCREEGFWINFFGDVEIWNCIVGSGIWVSEC